MKIYISMHNYPGRRKEQRITTPVITTNYSTKMWILLDITRRDHIRNESLNKSTDVMEVIILK